MRHEPNKDFRRAEAFDPTRPATRDPAGRRHDHGFERSIEGKIAPKAQPGSLTSDRETHATQPTHRARAASVALSSIVSVAVIAIGLARLEGWLTP